MELWVTGFNGQIGTSLTTQLIGHGHSVNCLGRYPKPVPAGACWTEWSLESGFGNQLPATPPEAIFHLAAQTSAYVGRTSPTLDAQVNIVGSLRLIDFAIKMGGRPPLVILAGSATQANVTHASMDFDLGSTFYDVAKSTLELYLRQYMADGCLDFCSLRLANVYGAVAADSAHRGFLNRMIREAVSGRPMTLFSGWAMRRDFIHRTDVAQAFMSAMNFREQVAGRVFEVGTGKSFPLKYALEVIANSVFRETGFMPEVQLVQPPAATYRVEFEDRFVDSSSFTKATGWHSVIPLQEGIETLVSLLIRDQ